MTRINTNVGSLVGRNNLQRANASLSQSLTRLSTGLRINTGKDDPAGLIASENLRSDITAIKKAISNTDRANQVIATADSALGQVSSLLNDIRGLVTESANSGALSDEQIAANQLQVDSSLEALNRIAQTTTFQGRRLLDGSLDFQTTAGTGFGQLSNLQIDQANLGATGEVSLDIEVSEAATKASFEIGGIDPEVTGVNSTGSLTFSDAAVASAGTVELPVETTPAAAASGNVAFTVETTGSTQADGSFTLESTGSVVIDGQTIELTGAANINVTALNANAFGVAGAETSALTGTTLDLDLALADGSNTVQDVIDAINDATGTHGITATLASGSNAAQVIDEGTDNEISGATVTALTGAAQIGLTAVDDNLADGAEGNGAKTLTVQYGQAQNNAVYTPGSDTLVVNVTAAEGTATIQNIVDAINNGADGASTGSDNDFTAVVDSGTATEVARSYGQPANFTLTDVTGIDPITDTRTIALTTAAGGDLNFSLEINAVASGSIVDADAGDGINAGITGNKDTGYTVTIANDAVVDLDNLATFLQNNITEVATATISGATASDDLDLRTAGAAAPGAPISVTGSQAQVTTTESIAIVGTTAAGASGNLSITFAEGNVVDGPGGSADRVNVSGDAENGYVVTIDNTESVTFGDIATELAAQISEIASATPDNAGTVFDTATFNAGDGNTTLADGRDAGDDVITITADDQSPDFDGAVTFTTGTAATGEIDVTVTDGDIAIALDSTSSYSLSDIADAISAQTGYTAELTETNGSGTFDANDANDNTSPVIVDLADGVAPEGGLSFDAVIELAGENGSEVFNLKAGTSAADLATQINLISDAIGVEAEASDDGTSVTLTSTGYGESAKVDLQVKTEATGGTIGTAIGGEGKRVTVNGTDIVATVNGVAANGDGNSLSINTATLDLSTSVAAEFEGTIEFDITGGGALFQLGPDVVSNQQARLGISSVNTAALGGVSGNLFQLSSGGTADLTTDATTAARIVNEAIDQVTSLRGRLGAFQRTTLETNKNALNDTLSNLTEAESSIRDADFAEETANLTRSQILVQSGTRVLAIANQNPQNVLGLLG